MTVKASKRIKTRSSTRSAAQPTKFVVTLSVKNGPFATRELVEESKAVLQGKGVRVSETKRISTGYKFTSYLGYGVPNAEIRGKVIRQLKQYAKTAKIPASAISISTRKV
jgi:hypothetical protein